MKFFSKQISFDGKESNRNRQSRLASCKSCFRIGQNFVKIWIHSFEIGCQIQWVNNIWWNHGCTIWKNQFIDLNWFDLIWYLRETSWSFFITCFLLLQLRPTPKTCWSLNVERSGPPPPFYIGGTSFLKVTGAPE